MGIITSGNVKLISELKVKYITALQILSEVQQHGRCRLEGVLASGEEAQRLLVCGQDIPAAVVGVDGDTTEILFRGIIKEGRVFFENGMYYIEMDIVTASALLDREKRQRSFQDVSMTYKEAVGRILEPYTDASATFANEAEGMLQTPFIQYGETDWAFLLRLGSRLHIPLLADNITGKPRFSFGMQEGRIAQCTPTSYHAGISARYYEAAQDSGIARRAFLYYSITEDTQYQIGDRLDIGTGSFTVFRKCVELDREVLRCTYWIGNSGNWYIPEIAHKQLAGMEFRGKVVHTQGEKLKVRLDMDGEQGGAEYEWGWTPVTGNLLYAMPEEGTTVKLCFGSEDASEGTVDVCVRENGAEMPQQQERLLTTAAGKQLALYPGQIFMGGSGGQAGITDGNAVSLGSAKRLRMTAAGVVFIHARDIHAQTPLEINMYRSPSGCEAKQRDIAAIGTRSNPPTGKNPSSGKNPSCGMNPSCGRGDSGFTMNFEFNGLSKSGLLCGTDFIKYRPFTDEPEEGIADTKPGIDKAELNKNVIIGDAAVVAAAVTVSCVAAAGGAVAAPVVLGLMTIVCGYSLVHGQARSDCQRGQVSDWTQYVGNGFKGASVGLVAGASFIYTPYAAEMAVAELVPAGMSGLCAGSVYVSSETLMTAAMTSGYTMAFTNMITTCNDSIAYATGENVMSDLLGQDNYELVRDAASVGSNMMLMTALGNPSLYGYKPGTDNIAQRAAYDNGGGGAETELFLPDEFYNKNLPNQVAPGTKYLPKYDELGNVKQIKMYDDYGREIGWVDYANHGYGDINSPHYHTIPHWHEKIYNAQYPDGIKINHRTDVNTPLGDK